MRIKGGNGIIKLHTGAFRKLSSFIRNCDIHYCVTEVYL